MDAGTEENPLLAFTLVGGKCHYQLGLFTAFSLQVPDSTLSSIFYFCSVHLIRKHASKDYTPRAI